MKRRDFRQLAAKSPAEIQTQLTTLSRELGEKRLAKRVGKLSDLRSLSRLADAVARLKTVLRQQELATVSGDNE